MALTELTPFDQAGSYIVANVLPARRVQRSQFHAGFMGVIASGAVFSADTVDPLQDGGGFNCVVELAASTCRLQVDAALKTTPLVRTLTATALRTAVSSAEHGGPLAQLASAVAPLTNKDYCAYSLSLSLHGLSFPDAETVSVDFLVLLSVLLPPQASGERPQQGRLPIPAEASWPVGGPMPSEVSPSFEPVQQERVEVVQGTDGGITFSVVPDNLRRYIIGTFTAELLAPLIHRDEPSRCQTRVFADLRRARWTESPPPPPAAGAAGSDAHSIYEHHFAGWLAHATSLLQAPLDLPLTPTLSLVGQNPGGAVVPEITHFEVRAFAIQSPLRFEPAVVVGFDVMPGCHGIVEDVRHFIGPNPYGVISDEFVVACLFQHRWNLGGFDRQLPLQSTVQVNVIRNGQQRLEDAVLYGYSDLLTLDLVSITTDSNTRVDCIRFGGQARVTASSVRMAADGQSFSAGEVDLGPPQIVPWGVRGELGLQVVLASDPEMRDFQIKASRDGARHIARPFAFFAGAQPEVTYVRVCGVIKHVFALGSLDTVLS